MSLYDFKTGGCRDVLQPQGPNDNEGAEATLSWLISLLTMIDILGQEVLVEAPTPKTGKARPGRRRPTK